ncbi:hypothetical protein PNOK_0148800 [Pyrrhoderma noxium]|uniref:Uncharacterized protein n=1 Tax=Pyrrhoderma noxium TaxID=2282107 RepID=A0A286UPJ7_9AGAM|nr:hypothetical protein PNOK_0148800 [Pyrrhoderma noxium]
MNASLSNLKGDSISAFRATRDSTTSWDSMSGLKEVSTTQTTPKLSDHPKVPFEVIAAEAASSRHISSTSSSTANNQKKKVKVNLRWWLRRERHSISGSAAGKSVAGSGMTKPTTMDQKQSLFLTKNATTTSSTTITLQ